MSTEESPIGAGWRGNINGSISQSADSSIKVSNIDVNLDFDLAWALCNILTDDVIDTTLNKSQRIVLSNLGAGIGRMIDHPSANNGGRKIIKL